MGAEEAIWRELLEDARWAPSPHNIQPWRVRLEADGTAALLCPPDRLLRDTDPESLFTAVGLGCFVEALAVAAAARTRRLAVATTGARPGDEQPVALLRLEEGVDDVLTPALLRSRVTSRLRYDGRPVADVLLRELGEIAAAHGHAWHDTSDPALVDWVVALNRETLFLDMADPVARAEVGGWLRFSEAEAARRGDGFSPAALGFPGWLLRLFFRRHRLLELPGVRHAARRLYGRTMRGTPTVAWLRGPFATVEDGLAAGRTLLRLWLTATRDGVQLHPFGSIVTNRAANAHLQSRIAPGPGTLWLIMRLGHSAQAPRSHRLEADALVVS